MVSAFFRRVAKHYANQMAVVTPNGDLLSHDLAEGLQRWRDLSREERRRLDALGEFDASFLPPPPEGGLIAAVFARALIRDEHGSFRAYKTGVARSLEAGRDHLWLTREEMLSLLPADPGAGAKQLVPPAISDRICRRYLIDLVRVGGNGGPRNEEDALEQRLQATVESVNDSEIRLRFDGSARLATRDVGSGARPDGPKIDEFKLLGFATFDRAEDTLTRFDLVAFSETGHFDEIHDKTLPLGVAFELLPATHPAHLSPPSSYGSGYFGESL